MTEKQNHSVYVYAAGHVYTAREGTVGYVSGDASAVVGTAANRRMDAERRRTHRQAADSVVVPRRRGLCATSRSAVAHRDTLQSSHC